MPRLFLAAMMAAPPPGPALSPPLTGGDPVKRADDRRIRDRPKAV